MRLIISVFNALYKGLEDKYVRDLDNIGKRNPHPIGGIAFWEFSRGQADENPYFVSFLKNMEGLPKATYIKKVYDYAKNKAPDELGRVLVSVGRNTDYMDAYLTYLGYDEPRVLDKMASFLATLGHKNVPLDDIAFQKGLLGLAVPTASEPTISELAIPEPVTHQQPVSNAAKLFTEKSPYLENTYFWFFFYGYDIVKGIKANDDKWPLVKLLLKFTKPDGYDISVDIINTGDPEHHHYRGKTDFENSSDTVLVINCRTYPGDIRQLNIKLHVGTARGSIFLGQYLNYETDGRIISGNIVVQRIKKVGTRKPSVHRIPQLTGENKTYTSNIAGVNKSIIQYLHDKKANFRRNPLRAKHDLVSLAQWLATYEK